MKEFLYTSVKRKKAYRTEIFVWASSVNFLNLEIKQFSFQLAISLSGLWLRSSKSS